MTHDDMPEVIWAQMTRPPKSGHKHGTWSQNPVRLNNVGVPVQYDKKKRFEYRRVTPPEVDLEELRYAIAEVNKMQFRLDKHYDLFMKAAAAYLKERG